jgi:hypothetical protein
MHGHTTVEVTFPSGADVLAAYWGALTGGGLRLPGLSAIADGTRLTAKVSIESSGKIIELEATVVGRGARPGGEVTYLGFARGAPHQTLLDLAWADVDGATARRSPRRTARGDLSLAIGHVAPFAARLINVSAGGCCVTVHHDEQIITTGDPVLVFADGRPTRGRVRWRSGSDLGVQFDDGEGALVVTSAAY